MKYFITIIVLIIACESHVLAQRSKRTKINENIAEYGLVSFSRPLSKDTIEVTTFIEVPFSSLQFVKRNTDFIASYNASIILKNKKEKQLLRKVWSDSIIVSDYIQTQSKLRTKKHYVNLNVAKDKYHISSELYDNDTRKKGSKKKKINFTKQNKIPSLMDPIVIAKLKGEWGFNTDQFPIIGRKISNIDNGLLILVSGFVDGSSYTIETEISGGGQIAQLPTIKEKTDKGFFKHLIKIEKEYLESFNTKINIELSQSNKIKTVEKIITTYKPGISGNVKNIENSFKQMKYILTNSERKNAKGKKGAELESIFLEYWDKRDPTPGTSLNELMEEYYIRVNYVNEYFNISWRDGWETDFGMIYILFGPPDEIQRSNLSSSNTSAYQIWYYNRINKQFIFKDQNGFGDYKLDRPFIGSSY